MTIPSESFRSWSSSQRCNRSYGAIDLLSSFATTSNPATKKPSYISYTLLFSFSKPTMLQPDVYWLREVEGVHLAIMPRPRGGEWLADEIAGYQRLAVQTVVSLLESNEARELDLVNEESLCLAANLQFLSFPIADRGVPSNSVEFAKFVESIAFRLRSGDSVAIHCRAGIGRSGLLAACVLGTFGVAPDSAFTMLGRARGVTVPDTDAQVTWVHNYLRNNCVPKNP